MEAPSSRIAHGVNIRIVAQPLVAERPKLPTWTTFSAELLEPKPFRCAPDPLGWHRCTLLTQHETCSRGHCRLHTKVCSQGLQKILPAITTSTLQPVKIKPRRSGILSMSSEAKSVQESLYLSAESKMLLYLIHMRLHCCFKFYHEWLLSENLSSCT